MGITYLTSLQEAAFTLSSSLHLMAQAVKPVPTSHSHSIFPWSQSLFASYCMICIILLFYANGLSHLAMFIYFIWILVLFLVLSCEIRCVTKIGLSHIQALWTRTRQKLQSRTRQVLQRTRQTLGRLQTRTSQMSRSIETSGGMRKHGKWKLLQYRRVNFCYVYRCWERLL